MPYELTWEDPRGYYVRFSGRVTPEDFARLDLQATSDARWEDARYAIIDFRGVHEHAFDLQDPESLLLTNVVLIGAAEGVNPHLNVAIVADDPAIRELMEREIETGALPFEAAFFRTPEEARDWLAGQTLTLQHLRGKLRGDEF